MLATDFIQLFVNQVWKTRKQNATANYVTPQIIYKTLQEVSSLLLDQGLFIDQLPLRYTKPLCAGGSIVFSLTWVSFLPVQHVLKSTVAGYLGRQKKMLQV